VRERRRRRRRRRKEHRAAEVWFLCYGLLKIKENVQCVHLELQRRTIRV
jgi:hypothetical protein